MGSRLLRYERPGCPHGAFCFCPLLASSSTLLSIFFFEATGKLVGLPQSQLGIPVCLWLDPVLTQELPRPRKYSSFPCWFFSVSQLRQRQRPWVLPTLRHSQLLHPCSGNLETVTHSCPSFFLLLLSIIGRQGQGERCWSPRGEG